MTEPTVAEPGSPVRLRPPAPVLIVIVLLAVAGVFRSVGLVYFGLLVSPDVNPDVGRPAAVAFAAVGLALSVTVLASLPGLWRGRRTAWHVLTCCVAAGTYFSAYKILGEGEVESVVFLAVDLVAGALLLLPATRRHLD